MTYRAGTAVSQTLHTMEMTDARGGLATFIGFVNPARWALHLYLLLFRYVTSGFRRMREVYADRTAIEHYGAESFKAGLRAVVVIDDLFANVLMPRLSSMLKYGKCYRNVYAAAEELRRGLTPDEIEQVLSKSGRNRASAFDSHPLDVDRLSFADRYVATAVGRSHQDENELLSERFVDWTSRSSELSALLTEELDQRGQPRWEPA